MSAETGCGAYHTSVVGPPASVDASHAALRHLWARTRIAGLSDFGPRSPSDERVATITSLGLTYGLLTRYTSFVAVQELVRRATDEAAEVDQPLPMPQGVTDLAIGVTSGAEPDVVWVFAIAVAALCAASLLRARRRRWEGAV